MPANINTVCDYIILRCANAGVVLNVLKLQKLLYYTQAWHLAFGKGRLFNGKFQAWVHGPVNRPIYDRFAGSKSLFSEVTAVDVHDAKSAEHLTQAQKHHINSVLDEYGKFSGSQLELMTHRESPWIEAREGLGELDRCEGEIDEDSMKVFYGRRLKK